MGKFEELSPKAKKLYEEGHSQKDIAKRLGVSEATLVEWKKKFEDTPFDWDMCRLRTTLHKKTVASWLEEQIQATMSQIESDKHSEDLLIRLDKFITMKKKYDGSIDKLGETSRVMGAFESFVREQFPNDVELVKEITNAFMRYMQL